MSIRVEHWLYVDDTDVFYMFDKITLNDVIPRSYALSGVNFILTKNELIIVQKERIISSNSRNTYRAQTIISHRRWLIVVVACELDCED